jgi:site-specific DNA-methyltransferase (adenine-specific)
MSNIPTLSPYVDIHPAAAIFPMLDKAELAKLADDIKANGLLEPIEILDGAVLDGRNRLAACELAGVEPRFRTLDQVESPTRYVLSKNLHRRQLTAGQRSLVGAEALPLLKEEARMRQVQLAGTRPNTDPPPDLGANLPQGPARRAPRARDLAGVAVGVSGRSIAKAREILDKAPDLRDQLRSGAVSLDAAAHQVRQRERQAEAAARPEPPTIPERIEVADVTERIPLEDDSVDLVLTSPPYALDKPYRGTGDIQIDGWVEFMTDWLREAYRVAKPNGRLALNIPLDTTLGGCRAVYVDAVNAAREAGWIYKTTIIWRKQNSTKGNRVLGSVGSSNKPHPIAEDEMIAILFKGEWGRSSDGWDDVTPDEWQSWGKGDWAFPGETRPWENHPAAFPLELPTRLIKMLSRVGDTVLDPFCGSGTAILAARRLKREGIGFDQSEDYVAGARRRLATHDAEVAA